MVRTEVCKYHGLLEGVAHTRWCRDFTDIDILQRFQESLPQLLRNQEGQVEHYFGMLGA
jgi:hypothetical protein